MENSKIYSILLYFDRIEQNRLRKYINSPYFNKNEALIELFELLISQINGQNGSEITKQKIWFKLNPDRPYDDVRFRKLSSDLLKLVEGYLAQEAYEENTMQKASFLMEAVARKKMDKLYQTCINTSNRLSEKYPFRSADYYYHQYEFEKKRYDLEFEMQRGRKSNIEVIINNLDRFYLGEKLKLYCDILSRQSFISHDYSQLFIDEIIEHVKKYKYEDIAPIAIYFQIYLTQIDSDNEEHYFMLKELLEKYANLFSKEESESIYGSALNYCIKKVNVGSGKFLNELFKLHEELLTREILLIDGQLSPWDFKNIVTIALRVGEFDWTSEFINDYNEKLPPAYRDNAVTFNMARLYWYKKDFTKVIELLREVEYEDVSYNLSSKAILLLTYYEMDELEPLYSLIDSFRAFLRRKKGKLPQSRIENYISLINIVKKLTKIQPGNSKAIDQLKKEVENSKAIATDQNWLLEKIAELK